MFKWRLIWEHFKQMNPYIAFGTILFLAGMVVGGTNPTFKAFLDEQLKGLGQLSEMIDNSSNPTLTMIIFIFLNNAIKSILVMYLGALFGILPFFFLVVNGMVIGYLLKMSADLHGGGYVADLVLKGLLPHGILEIPAIIIACAYGMRFGVLVLKAGGSIIFARSKQASLGRELESFVVRTVPVMVILTITLLIAAVIESTFTTWLLTM
ncbi:stage II sporulation protein M [Paenibacillus sp. PL91]|uniref:stage II sporulation protein M n=1 Tax=Paenibacillus sp. PL91 TaxID=2729538 RepID=UPI00145E609D|nr:stage II sporulation protein M [Paenibacillus sp. PL91]MBC9204640.1 stage II sporulation protein M [Paenibacillus sp. PL91]